MTLSTDDFRTFWREVHVPELHPRAADGPEPFPWQYRLVEHIVTNGRWPGVLDVPTGLGKTTALDIAVFTLGLSRVRRSGTTPPVSTLPRRIFMVVDRRIVVDQSFEHAQRIGEALRSAAEGSVAYEVANALRPDPLDRHDQQEGAEDEQLTPLVVGRMRGGTTWAWRWLERPDQPALIVGTIDQLGSRMLFNGYGVGETLRPIDAALTGADSLVLVDEAHLAEAFLTTLTDASRMGAGSEPLRLAPPEIVVMSATPPRNGSPPFQIDWEQELANPEAAIRLRAPKTLVAARAKIAKARRVAETGAALANVARELGRDHDVVGVVANTVAVARAAFDALRSEVPATSEEDDRVVLITGRQRPIDRDRLWDAWKDRLSAGRGPQDGPLYVVATQTIEVGADLDFSALVTESASIDALVQRLGRLNRRGKWARSTTVVVHPSTTAVDDPIYGADRQATWEWLTEQVEPQDVGPRSGSLDCEQGLDVGPSSLHGLLPGLDQIRTERSSVPVLFPSTFDRWVRTFPRSLDSPPTGPYLHGRGQDLPSVTLLWRHARRVGEVEAFVTRNDLKASVELLPPSPHETIDVPVWAVEAWVRKEYAVAAEVPDVTEVTVQPQPGSGPDAGLPFIMIDAEGAARSLRFPLRPGITVVAPTWRGGLDQYGWNPASEAPVIDVADLGEHRLEASGGHRARRTVLRIDFATLASFVPDGEANWLRGSLAAVGQHFDDGDLWPVVEEFLKELTDRLTDTGYGAAMKGLVKELSEWPEGKPPRILVLSPSDQAHQPLLLVHGPGAVERWSTESTHIGTSVSGCQVPLQVHQDAVAARAGTFANALGLPSDVCEAVSIAAAHHDVGKLDPRFQRMLNGGAVPPTVPLAKSGMDPARRWLFGRSQQLAGYPSGMRHEVFSARAAGQVYVNHDECDLIVHLIAAHHGRGRPLEQCVGDPDPITYEITTAAGATTVSTDDGPDWEQPRRFRELNARFGSWGLAMLETIVRLSDIGCSVEGS